MQLWIKIVKNIASVAAAKIQENFKKQLEKLCACQQEFHSTLSD